MVNHTMYSDEEDSQEDQYVNYKLKYRELKKNLRYLIYENECFQDELRKAQHNFVNISRDKSFLLDRILKYERPQGVSSDSEATESSDEEDETKVASSSAHFLPPKKKITKRKRTEIEIHNGTNNVASETIHGHVSPKQLIMKSSHSSKMVPGKGNILMKKPKKSPASRKPGGNKKEREISQKAMNNKNLMDSQILRYDINNVAIENEEQGNIFIWKPKGNTLCERKRPLVSYPIILRGHLLSDFLIVNTTDQELTTSNIPGVHFGFSAVSGNEGHMTREEVERHLESRRFSPELNTTATVPAELFSHEPDPESDFEDGEICEFIQLEEDGISTDVILE